MAATHEIKCINKSDRQNSHERISHVVGKSGTERERTEITQEKAIEGIENGAWIFYVTKNASRVNVIVSTSRYGNKYLKIEAD